MNQELNLSAVVPAYNESASLGILLPQLASLLGGFAGAHEIIVVDDGSRDGEATARVFQAALKESPGNVRAQLIRFSRNFGKEAALSAGLKAATGDAAVMLDSDGQHPLELITDMRREILAGNDMVAAVQTRRTREPWLKRQGKRAYYRFMQDRHRFSLTPNAGDFRMLNRKALDALLQLPEKRRFMKGLYAWIGFKTVYLPFEAAPRLAGDTKFSYGQLIELGITGILAFSTKPLRWISRMGLIVSLISLIYGLYVIFDALFVTRALPGWPTLAAGMMLLSGVQLVCIGVIGEYVGGIYIEVKNRPSYVIDHIEYASST